jgi:integrase
MPKAATPLTDVRIKTLKARDKRYLVSDGGGLVLEVLTSGSKVWRYRYTLNAKQQPLVTIGDYPAINLAAARVRAKALAATVATGVSPVGEARKSRGADEILNTLRELGDRWLQQEVIGLSESYYQATKRVLEKDVYPAIGNKALDLVDARDVMAICDRIKGRGSPQAALFARNALKRMYAYAISRLLVTVNPAQQIVARFIAKPNSRTRVLAPNEIGTLMRTIYASNMSRTYRLALHLLVITMVRKSDLIEAEWEELDLAGGIWRIPAHRMKMGMEHWVYLSSQAIRIFEELKELSTSARYIFPSSRGYLDQPIAKSTLNQAVRAMSSDVQHFVLHDFRRTASTHLNEMGHSSNAIEKALSHAKRGIEGVYNRAEYADERRRILQFWADFVDLQIAEDRKTIIGKFG